MSWLALTTEEGANVPISRSATALQGQDGAQIILMSDDMGRLSMITFEASRGKKEGARVALLGIVSRLKTIVEDQSH